MPAITPVSDSATCPCRQLSTGASTTRRSYSNCCKPLHVAGYAGLGTTPEATMRSRYSAYVVHDESYLLETWHPTTRPASIPFSTDVEWHGLTVIDTSGASLDTVGSVEFTARFRRGDAHLELHELSTFTQEHGRWFYVDGTDPDAL